MSDDVAAWVAAKLAEILELAPADISTDSRLDDDLDADSIDLIEVVNAAEAAFGVQIEEQELYDLETVGQLSALIAAARG